MNEFEKEIFSEILGARKVEIVLFLINNIDKNGFVNLKISQICEALGVSKPTVIETFKLLESRKIFERVKNGLYHFKNLRFLG